MRAWHANEIMQATAVCAAINLREASGAMGGTLVRLALPPNVLKLTGKNAPWVKIDNVFFLCTKMDLKSEFPSRVEVHVPVVELVQVVTSMAIKLLVWKLLKYRRFQKKARCREMPGTRRQRHSDKSIRPAIREDGTKTRSRVKVSL